MDIRVLKTNFDGVMIIDVDAFQDHRGFFTESYHKQRFAEHGLNYMFVQDNHSRSFRNVLRGFHYQDMTAPQFRLIRCTVGEVWDVVVDLRMESPTFGRWFGVSLTADSKKQILIPPEFAHAFIALSDFAEIQYKCTGYHTPSAEWTLAWDDPDIAVPWPVKNPVLSDRDKSGMSFKEYLKNPVFKYRCQAFA
jgi:dTDP-4-dehydrorhamnose 3,5-epimerase